MTIVPQALLDADCQATDADGSGEQAPMNAWGLALLAVVLNVAAQLALKLANGNLMSWQLGSALVFYCASFLLTLKIYAVNALSLAAPLMAGLTFVLTPLAAVLILGEQFGGGRLLGIGLILAGILVISRFQ